MQTNTIFLLIISITGLIVANLTSRDIPIKSEFDMDGTITKLLSRRKRFLIFPEGSSFQLVFCTQNHGYLQIGDIVWFGTTAALAWELPTDPQVFDMFRDRTKVYEAGRKTNVIYYVDEEGKVIDAVEYHRKPIINPAFAKRSLPSARKTEMFIKKMHNMQRNTSFFKDLDAVRIDFHRNARKSLYAKLEKFLQELGWNGKICILRMLCEASKVREKQGTFVEQILTAIFTLPNARGLNSDARYYDDVSHGLNADCMRLYPECE